MIFFTWNSQVWNPVNTLQVIRVKWSLHAREEIVFELLQHLRGNLAQCLLEGTRKSTREMIQEQEAVRGRLFTIQDVMQSTVRAWLQVCLTSALDDEASNCFWIAIIYVLQCNPSYRVVIVSSSSDHLTVMSQNIISHSTVTFVLGHVDFCPPFLRKKWWTYS